MGVTVTVGGVPLERNLPTATIGQPFRLYQDATSKPPKLSYTPFVLTVTCDPAAGMFDFY